MARSIMRQTAEREAQALDMLDPSKPNEFAKLTGGLRNLSTSKALQSDKIILPLTHRPSQIHGLAAPAEENLAALRRLCAQPTAPRPRQSAGCRGLVARYGCRRRPSRGSRSRAAVMVTYP